ncbi:hypothetical protein L6452_44202 [Arctium lappa]|uniref:Uncharacterized protein n=1 Tax=Arctium lappa TaxID=4217 RepID=A0ACB8XJ10_ARCLA|nr:hypothetical protein L6452_44202 [Arctium lappa]
MLEKTSSESGGVICFSQISNSALAVKPETAYRNEDIEVWSNNEVGLDGDVSEGERDESKSKEVTYSASGLPKGVGENIRKLTKSQIT